MELLNEINNLIQENDNKKKHIEEIDAKIIEINKAIDAKEKNLEISQNAINVLRQVSEKTVTKSYEYLEETINQALERIFKDRVRKIKIEETTRSNQYPQTTLTLTTENGDVELVDDGRGIGQIISFLVSICLIVITGTRRFMALDEVLDGLSTSSLKIMDDIIHDFTDIGFQFIFNQHNFCPKGAKVYKLAMENGATDIESVYIEKNGVFNGSEVEDTTQAEKVAKKGSKTTRKASKKASTEDDTAVKGEKAEKETKVADKEEKKA